MQSASVKDILRISKDKGFSHKSFEYSIVGNYISSDALFNHRDVPHFNHLHPNLAYGYGSEIIHTGETVSWIRYFNFLGIVFPILTLMKDDGKNTVLETFSFFCFYFLKVNSEKDVGKNKCESKITYYIGCKNKILLSLFSRYFKKMFKKSFDDYKNDDHPYLIRRGTLRKRKFKFGRDNTNFDYESTINIQKQRCFYMFDEAEKEELKLPLVEMKNNSITKFGDVGILGFQIYKKDNIIQIFHRVCPHEGGDLDVYNEVGIKYTMDKFLQNKCAVRCNVHNRLFKPMLIIDLMNKKKIYKSKVFDFEIKTDYLLISLNPNDKSDITDWTS